MKEKFISGLFFGLGFLLSFFIYTKLGFSLPLNIQSVVTNKNGIFTVTGEGKIVVIPDIAYVSLGIKTSGATVSQTQRKLNKINNQLIETLKNLGIDKKEIQTENYNLNPQYDWQNDPKRIIGYQAITTLKVKVKPLEKINQVIDEATKVGVNNIDGVYFEVDDKEKYLSKVRQQAVDEAKKKAKEVARIERN